MKKLIRLMLASTAAVFILGVMPSSTQAGPPPAQFILKPVKTHAELEALKPGTKISMTCPDCGMMVMTKVAKDRSNLHHFECPVCKHSFDLVPLAGGKASQAKLLCKDSKGRKMPLRVCAEMHK